MKAIIFALFIIFALVFILIAMSACIAASKADEREEELIRSMEQPTIIPDDFDPMAFVEEYNKEVEEESIKMMELDPPGTREFI